MGDPQNRAQYTMILSIRTPNMGPLILGNPHLRFLKMGCFGNSFSKSGPLSCLAANFRRNGKMVPGPLFWVLWRSTQIPAIANKSLSVRLFFGLEISDPRPQPRRQRRRPLARFAMGSWRSRVVSARTASIIAMRVACSRLRNCHDICLSVAHKA